LPGAIHLSTIAQKLAVRNLAEMGQQETFAFRFAFEFSAERIDATFESSDTLADATLADEPLSLANP
jgi:hypothetical protein